MAKTLPAAPGDVLAVAGGTSWPQKLIRVGAVLKGQAGISNHVKIITHQDELGRWIGIEGRPGGVGPCDCTKDLSDRATRSNNGQPRPGGQAATDKFLASCAETLGLRYDWTGLALDTFKAVGAENLAAAIDPLWRWPSKDGELPAAVVCSSLAAMLYDHAHWQHPEGPERTVTPQDWWKFNDTEAWTVKPKATPP